MKTFVFTLLTWWLLVPAHGQGRFGGGAGSGYASQSFSNTTLPVELVSFTVGPHPPVQAAVRWTTAREINHDYFEVQRSADGGAWQVVARLNGRGLSSELRHYTVLDPAPAAGTSFYRLRQVDLDGTVQYSRVATFRLQAGQEALRAVPNPTSGRIFLPGPVSRLLVSDTFGRTLLATEVPTASVDLTSLPAGVYYLRVGEAVQKIVKQ